MKTSDSKVSAQAIERLVVARLLVRVKRPLSRNEVVQSVAQAICPPLSATAAKRAAELVLTKCERSGLVVDMPPSGRSKRKSEPRPTTTPKARQLAGSWLGDNRMPVLKNWEHAQQWAALSMIGRAAAAEKVLHVDDLAAVILAERTRIPASASNLTAVIDHLAWRELGVETSAAFQLEAVQRHLLRKLVPADVRVSRATWRRMLAMRAAGAAGHDARALTQALFAQPSRPKSKQSKQAREQRQRATSAGRPTPSRTESSSANDNMPRRVQQPSLAEFAAAVRAAARKPTVARFHADRAFIGSVWDHMQQSDQVASMSLADFKMRLIAAHRDGLLRITRADLVAAMDRDEVERSEARYRDATFHFVAIEAGGGR